MPKPDKFVFVCINKRDPEHPRPSCVDNGSGDIFNALREEQGRRLLTDVKVVYSGCMEACMVGPVVAVYPDNIFYGGVIEEDIDEIMEHLAGGPPVERLMVRDAEFDLRPPEMDGEGPLPG